ncbi:MAG: FAD-dependent oxidoreductase [Chloroflexota bacterium]
MDELSRAPERPISRRRFIGTTAGIIGASTLGSLGLLTLGGGLAEEARADDASPALVGTRELPVLDTPCSAPRGPVAFERAAIAGPKIATTAETDVVVVGGGFSGTCAALAATDAGAKVVLLEKMRVGAARAECFASLDAKFQTAAKLTFDRPAIVNEILKAGDYRTRPEVVSVWADRSGEAADWLATQLADAGWTFAPVAATAWGGGFSGWDAETGFANPSLPADAGNRSGLAVIRVLADLAAKAKTKGVDLRFETPVVQLVRENGRVSGVIARDASGAYHRINARRGVILATGGYEANPDLLKAWCRAEDIDPVSWWSPCLGSTGDGHQMGLAVGAAMDPVPHAVMNFPWGHAESFWSARVWSALVFGILVNGEGRRFVNEDLPFHCISNAMNLQKDLGRHTWTVADAAMIGMIPFTSPEDTQAEIAKGKAKGFIVQADTIAGLADAMAVPAAALTATVETYNASVKAGVDKDFARVVGGDKGMPPIGDGPYTALRNGSCNLVTVSGLAVNEELNVVDANDQPIAGLYAVGNASGGFFSGNYPRHISGLSIGRCLAFGYVAGQNAAKEA